LWRAGSGNIHAFFAGRLWPSRFIIKGKIMRTNLTNGVQTASATGPVTAGSDVSAVVGDFTIKLRILALSTTGARAGARVVLEESIDSFATSSPIAVVDIQGPLGGNDVLRQWRTYEVSMSKIGGAGAAVRANISVLSSGTSIKLEAWIDS